MGRLRQRIPEHLRSWKTTAAIFGFALLFNGLTVSLLIGQWGSIGLSRGESMAPNSSDGEVDFTFRLVYRLRDPRRGEVVAVEPAFAGGEKWGKRIIGLPGETVTLDGTRVLVNGVELDEPYVRLPWTEEWYDEWELGPDEYWVMGDNRNESFDSRYVGPFSDDEIVAPLLPLIPVSGIGPLAVVGLVGMLVLFPGAPVAGFVSARAAAKRRGRRGSWGLTGALFLGVATALLLAWPPRRKGTDEQEAAHASRIVISYTWIGAIGGSAAGAFAGLKLGELVSDGIGLTSAFVGGVGVAVAILGSLKGKLPPPVGATAGWAATNFLVASVVVRPVSSDEVETALFASIAGFGPYVYRLALRYMPPTSTMSPGRTQLYLLASSSTWWAIAVLLIPIDGAAGLAFVIVATCVACAAAAVIGKWREWRWEALTSLAVWAALAVGAAEELPGSLTPWILRGLAVSWLLKGVWDCWQPARSAIPPPEEELSLAA